MPRTRVGELELNYEVEGQGPPVLMLMGLGGDLQGWALLRAELARLYRLVLLDNRDAGGSDEARGAYTLADMATDALGVMDHLGIERFHVAGASMGGAIAQHMALQAPVRVASMALVSTWGRTDAFLGAIFRHWRLLAGVVSAQDFLAGQLPWAFTYRYFQQPPAALMELQAGRGARGELLKSVGAYQRQADACLAHDVLDLLILLQTPTLVVVGEDDILTPARYARALATSLPRAQVTLVPAGSHACFLETPKPVTERLLAFLAQQPVVA